jgi:hypothetical protein
MARQFEASHYQRIEREAMSEHQHQYGLFGICETCGEQTKVWPVPIEWLTLDEMKERFPSSTDSADTKHD